LRAASARRRALHSFPTRRSSDLDLRSAACLQIRAERRIVRAAAPDADHEASPGKALQLARIHRAPLGTPTVPGGRRPDRLSASRSEEHTSELQSRENLVCRLLLE